MKQVQFPFLLLIFAALLNGCAGGERPQDVFEGVGWVQEKIDTAVTGIEAAYQTGGISQGQKNKLLDDVQKAKDAEAAALSAIQLGGGLTETQDARTLIRVLLRQLVYLGVLESEDD